MTITVHQRPIEATRTANKSCKWQAEAIVKGRAYTATSRMAPANDIARQLVADGFPDAPMQVYAVGLKGCLSGGRSIRRPSGRSRRTRKCRSEAAATVHSGSTPRGAGGPKRGGEGSGRYPCLP